VYGIEDFQVTVTSRGAHCEGSPRAHLAYVAATRKLQTRTPHQSLLVDDVLARDHSEITPRSSRDQAEITPRSLLVNNVLARLVEDHLAHLVRVRASSRGHLGVRAS
jgi:hypothetical protein